MFPKFLYKVWVLSIIYKAIIKVHYHNINAQCHRFVVGQALIVIVGYQGAFGYSGVSYPHYFESTVEVSAYNRLSVKPKHHNSNNEKENNKQTTNATRPSGRILLLLTTVRLSTEKPINATSITHQTISIKKRNQNDIAILPSTPTLNYSIHTVNSISIHIRFSPRLSRWRRLPGLPRLC